MRVLIEFQGLEGNEKANLKVFCFDEKSGEIDKVVKLLKEKGFTLTHYDSYNVEAEIYGEFNRINRIGKELQKEGFTWSEAILKAGIK